MATLKDVIRGLQAIADEIGDDEQLGGADHDILYAAPGRLSAATEAILEECGFHHGEEDGWSRFV